ncbi:MAG: HAMP domain-containing histidine kinase [Lachnospiraceae bacterium]|nr:HAMP domain-containing histidine kinase [Lachnospiraceae bacterium]MBQ7781834.1 HAMP domain-containing histidine kinase [Lachnospiraceae bacterium]
MKKHSGLTRGGSILFHTLQQITAFFLTVCIATLVIYSIAGVKAGEEPVRYKRTFEMNLFSEEKRFDETGTFDQMLMSALQEIIRYNVAKSQLETDGRFDGEKIIDVRAFANRKTDLARGLDGTYMLEEFSETYKGDNKSTPELSTINTITAEYYLEDLLKWEKYGFYYEYITIPEEEFVTWFGADKVYLYDGILTEEQKSRLQEYFASGVWYSVDQAEVETYVVEVYDADTTGTFYTEENINESVLYDEEKKPEDKEETYTINQMHQALLDIMEINPALVSGVYVDDSGEIFVDVRLLQERYKTIDDENLLAIANSWKEYQTLVDYVEQAVYDLAYNYGEYKDFKERYETGATNIVYIFNMTMMGEAVSVSNLADEANLKDASVEELDAFFRSNYGRYVIYRPQTMTFESNTGIIEEAGLFDAFSSYEYAYPETAEIWLAVDTNYPAEDSFAESAEAYETMRPFAYALLIGGIVAGVFWIVLLVFLSVMTGWRKKRGEKEGTFVLHWFDAIYTEVMAVMGVVVLYAMAWGVRLFYAGLIEEQVFNSRMQIVFTLGACGMLLSMMFNLFWYSFLRRIKGRVLFKGSLLYLLWKNIVLKGCKAVKRAVLTIYDNSSIVFKCVVVVGGLLFVNFLWGFLTYEVWRFGTGFNVFVMLFVICAVDGILLYLWFHNHVKRKGIVEGIARIRGGDLYYQVSLEGMHGENKELAEAVNSIGEGIKSAVETSMKDERLKADLITNVSHDIKTPLTSIINYVDLLKREKIEEEPVKGYIAVLDAKSQRLKQLTDDLVEASKISSGNITLIMEKINLAELLQQALGEFSEKFEQKRLEVVMTADGEPVYIEADSRRIWRVVENLLNNIFKYALEGTRIYLDMFLAEEGNKVTLSLKNISAQRLNIKADELTERFIRGDVSRSTEGSGLGLSIAKNLTELQNGSFDIYLDGDLFKVTLTFPVYEQKQVSENALEMQ